MRVLIIGIDGGTWDVLGPACDRGLMPNLNRFRTEGAWGVLNSTHPPITPAAWTTLMTGMNPGHHGVPGFFDYDLDKKQTSLTNSSSIRKETLWQKLARHGNKVVVVGVPMTYPPLKVNGILVSGLGTPSTRCRFSHPPEFQEEVLKQIPEFVFSAPFTRKGLRKVRNFAKYLEWHRKSSHHMVEILRMGMARVPWTVSMVVLRSFDEMMHHFWKLLDFSWDTSSDPRDGLISRYFKELDEVIGMLLKLAEDNQAAVFTVSDHGGAAKLGTIYPNKILRNLGYLKLIPRHRLLWQQIRHKFRRLNPFDHTPRHNPDDRVESIDFASSQAVVTGVKSYADLYVQDVTAAAGQDSEKTKTTLINELRQKLLQVKMPDGKPLFKMAATPHELYGELEEGGHFPDLMIAPRDGYTLHALATSKESVKMAPKDSLSGDHSPNGMIGATGPQFASKREMTANIADIAPTILAMLGLPVTKDMDGEIIQDAFRTPLSVNYEDPADTKAAESYRYSDAEQDEINSRLANLGYL